MSRLYVSSPCHVQLTHQILILVAGTITTGCLNSIFTKYQDEQCVADCGTTHPKLFVQPVLQTLQMFIGEMLCWVLVACSRMQKRNNYVPLISEDLPTLTTRNAIKLAVPAVCDIVGTTLMNLGLLFTPVSIYQMTRGSLILFVAIFSVFFLRQRISRIEWCALFVVVLGVFIVGLSGSTPTVETETSTAVILGISLIFFAEIFTASQFVFEEHILSSYSMPPLQLVGWEGLYGCLVTLLGMLAAHLLYGSTERGIGGPFDMVNGFREMFSNKKILWSSLATMLSIGSFNFFGMSITSKLSATSRSTIDTSRTLMVWLVALSLGWESFSTLQLFGFVLLVVGTLVFNGAIELHFLPSWMHEKEHHHVIDVVDEEIERM